MAAVIVWYLLLTRVEGGITVVPQTTQAQCISNADWLNRKSADEGITLRAFCIEGRAP